MNDVTDEDMSKRYTAAAYVAQKFQDDSAAQGLRKSLYELAKNRQQVAITNRLGVAVGLNKFLKAEGYPDGLTVDEARYCANWGIAAAELLKDKPDDEADLELCKMLLDKTDLPTDGVDATVIGG